MLIRIIYPNGAVQVETAFNTVEECAKALFVQVPEGTRFEVPEDANKVESAAKVDAGSGAQPEVRKEGGDTPKSRTRVRKSGQEGGEA